MKSDKKSKECQTCYKRAKETGALLFCEATGYCKYARVKE